MVVEDLDLGERDHEEETPGFPPAERKLVTQAYDLSVSTLTEWWQDGSLIIPDFQREYVWDNPKASRLIESLLLNIPIPVVYLAENEQAEYLVVDGHQRIFSIVRYLDNQFRLSGLRISEEFKGLRFFELPEREQRFLKRRMLRAIIITAESHHSMKFEIFERLNTGGVALNAQEVRNAIYRGVLNDRIKELETNDDFRVCIGRTKPRKRMVDRELIVRFMALKQRFEVYRPPLLRFLNDFMSDYQNPDENWLEEVSGSFVETCERVSACLGAAAFRVINEDGEPTERNLNRALYDAQMLSFSMVVGEPDWETIRQDIFARTAGLVEDDDFENAIRRATGDRARLRARVSAYAALLADAGLDVDQTMLGPLD